MKAIFTDGTSLTIIPKIKHHKGPKPRAFGSHPKREQYGRVIRIDADVWAWIRSQARPLEDTPNSVLRRVAGLGPKPKRIWR
jgi:hypothetical protein